MLKYRKVSFSSFRILGKLRVFNEGIFTIGDNFRINSGIRFNPIGGDSGFWIVIRKNAQLKIGDNFSGSNSTIVCEQSIVIGNNVMIGGSCKIWDTDFHSLKNNIRGKENDNENANKKEICIGDYVFIGGFSIILKGVTIGEKSIIAAGSVVSCNIPEGQVWGGNPAKFIRNIN